MAPTTTGRKAALPADTPNKDIGPDVVRREYLFTPPSFVQAAMLRVMKDPADLPLVFCMFNVLCLIPTSAAALFLLPTQGPYSWVKPVWCVAHLALLAVFMERFFLALHYSAHLRIFVGPGKLGAAILNSINGYLLAPFFGMPSGVYYLHHVIMHHIENNVCPDDLSSTMPFQRDSLWCFVRYWLRFTTAVWGELPYYAFRKGRYEICARSLLSITLWFTTVCTLWRFDGTATLFTLVLPFVLASVALMFGNWSQHIFVDPDSPFSNYKLTYNIMNSPNNQTTFNDGYHVVHHINSRVHWSKLPHYFMDNIDTFAREDAFLFKGLAFFDVGLLVMTGRLHKLAEYYIPYGQEQRTRDEIVAEFKRRLAPIHTRKPRKA